MKICSSFIKWNAEIDFWILEYILVEILLYEKYIEVIQTILLD